MTGSAPLVAAVIAAAVSLLVAIGTQIELTRRERRARAYDRRRAALLDTQDAVVAVRGRLRDYGATARAGGGLPSTELDDAQRRFDDARDRVVVTSSRVDDVVVIERLESWLHDAEQRFVSRQDVSPRTESDDWDLLHAAFAEALRSSSGRGTRRG
ncbi:hypothetical protein ACXR2U_19235 [Jatrophihabitans sp. YIM 134969]